MAIKVSEARFSLRFERESKAISALNHANICTLYDVGPNYLVMEMVEGESLAALLTRGKLGLNNSIKYALQIAEAFEAAHEKGITHRDLKPANIMVTPAGVVKVLDFGLAKTPEFRTGSCGSQSDNGILPATKPGLIIGTPSYMSPEQASGKPLDKRSDIWSFGAVLYEMLTGSRPFTGETTPHILAVVLTGPIHFEKLPAGTPEAIRELLVRCLDRDVEMRLRDIGEARIAIRRYLADLTPKAVAVPERKSSAIPWTAAAVFALIAAVLGFLVLREKPPEAPVERFSVPPPENAAFDFTALHGGSVEVSPDGRRLLFTATVEGKVQLWIRALALQKPVALAGTEGATLPFWSADSEQIGFFADGKLKRVPAAGGMVVTLCDGPYGFSGGAWNGEGVIVFAPESRSPLYRISASGGTPSPATELDSHSGETSHRFPWFLPDGRHFLFGASGGGRSVLRVASLVATRDAAAGDSRVVIPSPLNATNVAYSQGHLLFVRGTTLMAQPFDTRRLATNGNAVPLAEHIQGLAVNGRAAFGVSANGMLAYKAGPTGELAQLVWFDRDGRQAGTLGQPANLNGVRLSPDQKSAVINILDASTRNKDLWIYDVPRRVKTRFTFDPAEEREAIWSPDGRSIVFNSHRKGHFDLYRKASSGAGAEELLYADAHDKYPTSFSPDGKLLLYMVYVDGSSKNQLWILPLDGTGERKPAPFAPSDFNSAWGQFSPDGKWIAYVSDEGQRNEVYVAPFTGSGGKKQISSAGGDQPAWRGDGKEIFYVAPNGQMMAVAVNSSGGSMELGTARPLFGSIPPPLGHSYDVSKDGQRFLVRVEVHADEPLTLVQNWTGLLKQ